MVKNIQNFIEKVLAHPSSKRLLFDEFSQFSGEIDDDELSQTDQLTP